MGHFSISNLIAYVVALVTGGLGLAIATRLLNLNLQPTARYVFGAVLILMGVYRFLITFMKANAARERKKIFDEDE
jgi:cytochrome c biogenesis protein CcdA